jgi:hypothetical protein
MRNGTIAEYRNVLYRNGPRLHDVLFHHMGIPAASTFGDDGRYMPSGMPSPEDIIVVLPMEGAASDASETRVYQLERELAAMTADRDAARLDLGLARITVGQREETLRQCEAALEDRNGKLDALRTRVAALEGALEQSAAAMVQSGFTGCKMHMDVLAALSPAPQPAEPMIVCPNCGKSGAHFIGPSFGEDGHYLCPKAQP